MHTSIIAEIGNAHDGSLGNAHAFIDAVADRGADAVKFQCRVASEESTEAEQFRPGCFFPQDRTRLAYWQRMEFSRAQWEGLSRHARARGLRFGVSVFCSRAVAVCGGLVDFWKVPAPTFANIHVQRALAGTPEPIYWSMGFSGVIPSSPLLTHVRITPLACVSRYPSFPESLDLSIVSERVGLSDHSGTIWPAILAAGRRAPAVEVHVCWHREAFGPDATASITVDQLGRLVEGVRWVERLGREPITDAERRQDFERWMIGRRVA